MRRPEPAIASVTPPARRPFASRAIHWASAILLLCGAAVPAGAAIPRTAPAVDAVAPAELRAAMEWAIERAQAGDCAGALARLDPLLPGLAAGAERNGVQRLRLAC